MKKPRAYFFDLDGTAYYHKIHDVMPSTLEAWKQLKAQGDRVVIATSRCLKELGNFREEIKNFPFDAIITDGGALIIEQDKIMRQLPIAKESMKRLDDYCKQHHLIYRYSTFDGDYFNQACNHSIRSVYFQLYLSVPIVKAYDAMDDVYNVLLYVDNKEQEQELQTLLADCAFTDHQAVIEVTHQDVNKITAIHWLCEKWGIDKTETMAFGDGYNDVEMLKQAGIGVAMGNGVDACKAVANYVCDRIEKDGIFKILKELKMIS